MHPHVEFVIMEAVLPIMPLEIVAYAFLFFGTTFPETAVYKPLGAVRVRVFRALDWRIRVYVPF